MGTFFADYPDSDSESTSTNPFPAGHVESRLEEQRRLHETTPLDDLSFKYGEDKPFKIILKHPRGNEAFRIEDSEGSTLIGHTLWGSTEDVGSGFSPIQLLGIKVKEAVIILASGVVSCGNCHESQFCVSLRNLSEGNLSVTGRQVARNLSHGESIVLVSGCWELVVKTESVELGIQHMVPTPGAEAVPILDFDAETDSDGPEA